MAIPVLSMKESQMLSMHRSSEPQPPGTRLRCSLAGASCPGNMQSREGR